MNFGCSGIGLGYSSELEMIMFRTRKIVLTETACNLIEDLRDAIEVATGQKVRLRNLTLDKLRTGGHGEVINLSWPIKVFFSRFSAETIYFSLREDNGGQYEARRRNGEVWVMDLLNGHVRGDGAPLYWVGIDKDNRREVPMGSRQ